MTTISAPNSVLTVQDILVPGFVSQEQPFCRFCPNWNNLYIVTSVGVLRFRAEEGVLHITQEPPGPSHIPIDEDDEFCMSSLTAQVLGYEYSEHLLMKIEEFIAAENKCSAVGLHFNFDRFVFLDPSNYWGIQFGSHELLRSWRERYPMASSRTLSLSDQNE